MPSDSVAVYAIFHLNLAFSSVDETEHLEITKQCYWPLLHIIQDHDIPLGIELTAYTLERIHALDPQWVSTFRELLRQGKCELLASGDSQIIGPLVPSKVNQANLQLGLTCYRRLLGVTPRAAYINEQAVSSGLLDIYRDCGFEAVVVEWDNPYSHNPEWSAARVERPQSLSTAKGESIKVIWNNAIAFQKLQRYAHGELALEDYIDFLRKNTYANTQCFSIYGSDAEVFDYRPGRYTTEVDKGHQEWGRITALFTRLQSDDGYHWRLPSETLDLWQENIPLKIATTAHPISVKKQAKYNITRWALSGRNDLLLNSTCYAEYHQLAQSQPDLEAWRPLCRLWASDLRTHLTQARYEQLLPKLATPSLTTHPAASDEQPNLDTFQIYFDQARNKLHIRSDEIICIFNVNRGLSIESLAFKQHDFQAVCGTLAHGHFQHIRFGADFYSNHLVMERFRERDRVTDLSRAAFSYRESEGTLTLSGVVRTPHGDLLKSYRIESQTLSCSFSFDHLDRPEASLRLGYISLLDCQHRPWFACHNGGDTIELFEVDEDVDHGAPVSSIVSANSALGATTGEFMFGTHHHGVQLTWDPSLCSALPMVSSSQVHQQYLNRCWFSLIEADETLKPQGRLPPFSYAINPISKP